jgi:YggT family protein
MGPLKQAALFLIQSLFTLGLFVLLLRLIFQYLRVDYYNPISQFVVKLTSPIIVPLRRIIPGYWGIDFATVTVIYLVSFFKLFLISLIVLPMFPNILGLMISAIGDILGLTLNLFFYAIFAYIIVGWLAPYSHSPIRSLLHQITEPLLRPFRKKIPPIAGFDISPLFVLMALQLLNILVAAPLSRIII